MKLVLLIATTVLAGVLIFGLATWWALESSGVAVVTTTTKEGEARNTHVWFVESDGELWLEAGNPQNPWYQDVLATPRLTITTDEWTGRAFDAETVAERSAEIRARLRDKYGVRDRWVGMLVDSSQSLAVRLVPVPRDGDAN